ncbi:MAG: hypothetical protein IKU25_09465 [Clostridia bacterium]|nr:hypothetical protein [Clostridia bacterium]
MLYNYDLSRDDWETMIEQYIFDERDRKVLKRRLLDGKTYEALAEEFDMSTQNVKRIVYKGQKRLLKFVHIVF